MKSDPLLGATRLFLLGQDATAVALLEAAAASPTASPALKQLLVRVQMVVLMAEELQALRIMGDTDGATNLRAIATHLLADIELARGLPQSFASLRVAVARFLTNDLTHLTPA